MPFDREAIRRQHRHREYRARVRHPIAILADEVDKEANIGGILRNAEAFMAERVIFSHERESFTGAMGAEYWQPVEWGASVPGTIRDFRNRGYAIVALEQSESALPLADFEFPERVLLVVGAEQFGVSRAALDLADETVYIPQEGLVKSLNVHVATAIALYEYARQHWMSGFQAQPRHSASADKSLRLQRHGTAANDC